MPTYDYKCNKCGHQFEAFQSMTEPPLGSCPQCGSDQVQRLISPGAGFLFKGSGFYITDYRKESYKKDASKEAPDTAKIKTSTKSKSGSSGKKGGAPPKSGASKE